MESTQKPIFDEIIELIEKRKATYKKGMLEIAVENVDDSYKIRFGRITFLADNEQNLKNLRYDYNDFHLIRVLMNVPEAIQIIRDISEKSIITLEGFGQMAVEGEWNKSSLPSYIASHEEWGYSPFNYPHNNYYFSLSSKGSKYLHMTMVSKGVPLYRDSNMALIHFFNMGNKIGNVESRIDLVLPDYRARMEYLKIKGKTLSLKIDARLVSEQELLAKFCCETDEGLELSEDLKIENGFSEFTTRKEPNDVLANLILASTGEDIDRISFNMRWYEKEKGVIVEKTEEELEEMINRGERLTVEFKVDLDKELEEFKESLISFANTKGGTIFLGVNDNGRVVGFDKDVKDQITNIIEGNCEPRIEFEVMKAQLYGRPITVVLVYEGKEKPYVLKQRGVFIRSGSTDRQARRRDLDEIYKKPEPYAGLGV